MWPRCLSRGTTVARLLGLQVRILQGAGWLSLLSVVCFQTRLRRAEQESYQVFVGVRVCV